MTISFIGAETLISFRLAWADSTLLNIEVNRTLLVGLLGVLALRQGWRLVKLYRAPAQTEA